MDVVEAPKSPAKSPAKPPAKAPSPTKAASPVKAAPPAKPAAAPKAPAPKAPAAKAPPAPKAPEAPKAASPTKSKVPVGKDRETELLAQLRTKMPPPGPQSSGASDTAPGEVPPASNPVSCTIRVDGFVRPFTLPKAQALVAEMGGGPLVEKGFWMNAIKTHCYATFSCTEHAAKAREALYNLVWPERGGTLKTDFSDKTAAEVAAAFEADRASRLSGIRPPTTGKHAVAAANARGALAPSNSLVSSSSNGSLSVSQMDVEAGGVRRKREDGASPEDGKRARVGEEEGKRLGRAVVQQPTFDELFRSTTTLPRLYWKTVTEERVLVKRKRAEELKKNEEAEKEKKANVK